MPSGARIAWDAKTKTAGEPVVVVRAPGSDLQPWEFGVARLDGRTYCAVQRPAGGEWQRATITVCGTLDMAARKVIAWFDMVPSWHVEVSEPFRGLHERKREPKMLPTDHECWGYPPR